MDDRYAGQGVGSALVQAALDAARRDGSTVLPFCPFVRCWVQRHPAHLDLVPAGRRAEFGLEAAAPPPDPS